MTLFFIVISTERSDEKSYPIRELKLIASGGISEYNELPRLKNLGCEGVIVGKAIYENKISLKEIENFILNN